jgi:hypothetical protein
VSFARCIRFSTRPASGIASADQAFREVCGLADRVALRNGDEQEGRLRVLQDPVRLVGALPEPAEHRVQRSNESGQVGQQLSAKDLLNGSGEQPERRRDQAEHARPPRGRRQQHPQHPAVQEPGQPRRRVQEVQRRAGRRGVHHDQVPLVAGAQLAQLLHRHVLLRAGEGRAHGW